MSLNQNKQDFLVGRIVGFHGLNGQVKVRPATNNPALLLGITKMRTGGAWRQESVEMEVDELLLEKRLLFVTFKGYYERTAVEHLEGADLFACATELKPLEEEEFWVRDLIGASVFTTDGRAVGTVIDIIYGGNDILEIRSESHAPGKSILVPFVKTLVPSVNLSCGRIEVVDVPGLLEPQ